MHILKPIRMICLAGLFFINCAKTIEETKKPDFCTEAENKKNELLNLGNDLVCSTVTDCRSTSYGYGCNGLGVTGYLISSKLKVTDSQVQDKVSEYNQIEKKCAASANAHTCATVVVIAPTLACLLSICTDTNP